MKVELALIQQAQKLLENIVKKTELDFSSSASQRIENSSSIYFKFENTQRTGSFKIRGAYNRIANLSAAEKAKGVVTSSAGNHAQGVALSAQLAKVKSYIVMPETAPLNKQIATRSYGAEVLLRGEIYDEAYEYARALEKEKGYVFVSAFEDPWIIAGQGTIGLEIVSQLPDVDSIVVPIGGGGLISGIAIAAKSLKPSIKIIGVQSSSAPGMSQLFHKAKPDGKRVSTIADGIAVKKPSQSMYDNFISKYVDDVVTVTDDELAESIVFLLERVKTVAEGSGAASLAAVFHRGLKLGKKTCVLLSGGNIDLNMVSKIIDKAQTQRGRLAMISVIVDDLPGSLSRLTQTIAAQKANVLEVHHDRVFKGLFLRETRIDFVLETTSPEHVESIKKILQEQGGRIV